MSSLLSLIDRTLGLAPSDGRSYLFPVRQCPPLAVPAGFLDPHSSAAVVAQRMDSFAAPPDLISKFNFNAVEVDNVARYGGGGRGVVYGLDLVPPAPGSLTPLELTVKAGLANIDDYVSLPTDTTQAIVDNTARTLLYLTQAGALSPATNLSPPGSAAAYLGSVPSGGNRIGTPDYSGVARLRGGVLWRRTADPGPPDDTLAAGWTSDPPSSLAFFHRTDGGLWFWDGLAYSRVDADSTATDALLAALEATGEEQERKFRRLLFNLAELLGSDILPGLECDFERAVAEAA